MLLKIIKNELKLSIYESGILCIALLGLGFSIPIFIKAKIPLISISLLLLYILLLCACSIYSLIIMYRIFYKSVFDNEGYLTNVIPVKTSSLVIGKFLTALILMLMIYASIIISLYASIVITYGYTNIISFLSFFEILFADAFKDYIILGAFNSFFSLLLGVSIFFLISAFYNTFRTRKYRTITILALWIITNIIVSQLAQIPAQMILGNINADSESYLSWARASTAINVVCYSALCVGTLALTTYIIKKKVDIE